MNARRGRPAFRAQRSGSSFAIPDNPDCLYRVYNRRYLLTHGEQFRGGDGMIGALGATPLSVAGAQPKRPLPPPTRTTQSPIGPSDQQYRLQNRVEPPILHSLAS